MTIGGVSIILILGIFNLLLIFFQLLSGLHVIKVGIKVHRKTGITLLITALIHSALAFLANL